MGARPREVADPQDRGVAHEVPDPRPQLGAAGLPPRRLLPYLRLLPAGFSCVTTITIAFLSNQHDIKYVDTPTRSAGVSKFHFVNDAYRYILQVLRMVMYFDPLKVLMPPALWMIVIGWSRPSSTWSGTRSTSRRAPCCSSSAAS